MPGCKLVVFVSKHNTIRRFRESKNDKTCYRTTYDRLCISPDHICPKQAFCCCCCFRRQLPRHFCQSSSPQSQGEESAKARDEAIRTTLSNRHCHLRHESCYSKAVWKWVPTTESNFGKLGLSCCCSFLGCDWNWFRAVVVGVVVSQWQLVPYK